MGIAFNKAIDEEVIRARAQLKLDMIRLRKELDEQEKREIAAAKQRYLDELAAKKVQAKRELIARKPQLTKKLQGIVKVVEGSTIKLEVQLYKNTTTTCTWFKSGAPIEHSDKFQVWHADALH